MIFFSTICYFVWFCVRPDCRKYVSLSIFPYIFVVEGLGLPGFSVVDWLIGWLVDWIYSDTITHTVQKWMK